MKRKSPQGDLKQETYRKHPVLSATAERVSGSSPGGGAATITYKIIQYNNIYYNIIYYNMMLYNML